MSRASSLVALSLVIVGCGGSGPETMDTGPGTEAGDVEQAHCQTPASESFARPFAVDSSLYPFESCAMQTEHGLPGLGMLITAEVARRAGWSVAYEPLEPTGLKARIRGPVEV